MFSDENTFMLVRGVPKRCVVKVVHHDMAQIFG